jgi:hypothetical protein
VIVICYRYIILDKNEFANSKPEFETFMDLSSQRLISGICGAGIILLCESEYSCLKLFKRKTTLFFFVCQLAIWSTALETALTILLYFLPNLRVLPMLVIILIAKTTQNMSYPIMILLRLRFICNFSRIIMYIPVVLAIIVAALEFFWVCWILTDESYYLNVLHIILPTTTILLTVQNILINIFFIVIAIKHFQNVVHVRSVIVVNIIVIALECVVVVLEFSFTNRWILFSVRFIIAQIEVRLEIEILSYIVQSARERRVSDDESETRNKFCYFFLWRSRTAGLT